MTNKQKLAALYRILEDRDVYARAIGKLDFDLQCCAPEEGMDQAGQDIAVLSRQYYKFTHSKRFERLVCELHEDGDGLTDVQKKLIEHLYDDYEKEKNISAELDFEINQVRNQAYSDWLRAKRDGNYAAFAPVFQRVVELTRKSIDVRDRK